MKSSPTAPTRSGRWPRLAMPNAMLAATPPRRTCRSSARNESEILSSCSTTRESAKQPVEGHEVVGRDGTGDRDLHGTEPTPDMHDGVTSRPGTRPVRPGGLRAGAGRTQLKESPQAQLLPALGLSMVKPCFSIVSAKSIVAPSR